MDMYDVLCDVGRVLEAEQLLDDALGFLVAGMRLAGQDELHRVGPGQQGKRPAGIVGEEQRRGACRSRFDARTRS